jgi:hypothetical protein
VVRLSDLLLVFWTCEECGISSDCGVAFGGGATTLMVVVLLRGCRVEVVSQDGAQRVQGHEGGGLRRHRLHLRLSLCPKPAPQVSCFSSRGVLNFQVQFYFILFYFYFYFILGG